MIHNLKPYPAYKDSGVPWLGEVPEHWEVRRIKSLSMVKRGASPRPIDDARYFDQNGDFAWVRIADVTRSARYLERTTQRLSTLGVSLSVPLRPGALFLSIAGSVGKPIITKINCCIHDGFVYFPQYRGNTEFLYYLFASGGAYAGLGKLGTQLNLNTETVGSIQIGWPPLREQAAIVRFLDYVDRRIRRYIGAKQKLIKLLEEQKQATIHHAVTRSLDPNVRLKPSGVEWLGDVPEHWDMLPNRAILKLKKEAVGGAWSEYTLLSLTKRGVIPRDLENPEGKFPTSFDTYQAVKRGDLIFCLFDIDETPRAVGLATVPGMITGAYTRFAPKDSATVDFVYLYYLAMDNGKRLKPLYSGLRKVITKSAFLSARMPIPPAAERQAIVEHIRTANEQADAAIERTAREIILLREYRARLIAEVVTGKLDVREAAKTMPDEIGDEVAPPEDLEGDGAEDLSGDLEDDAEQVSA